MKKKYIYLFITFIMILFTNNLVVDAKTKTVKYIFENKYFPENLQKDGNFYFFASAIANAGFNVYSYCTDERFGVAIANGQLPCDTTEDVVKFELTIKSNTPEDDLKMTLNEVKGFSFSNDDAKTWVSQNYCKSWSENSSNYSGTDYDKVCKAIKGDAASDKKDNSCTYEAKTDGVDLNISFAVMPQYGLDLNKRLQFYNSDDNKQSGKIMSTNAKVTLYLYSYGGTFEDFSEQFMEKYNNNNKCPTLSYCKSAKEENTWYTVFDKTKCSNLEYYTGESQETTENGEVSEEGITRLPLKDLIYELFGDDNPEVTCESIFEDNSLKELLIGIKNVMFIFVPIILLGLGSLDFAKSVFAGDENAIKKAQQTFIKRLIIALAIFLIPSLLKLILTIAHTIWEPISADFCGIL